MFTDQPSKELCDLIFQNNNTATFVWHPDISSPFERNDGNFMVAPTSSTRTLLTQNLSYNFMAKTDLDKRHFRFIRRLKGSSVEHSLAINRDIRQATETSEIPFYAYLPETIGFIYGDMRTGSGVIYRELKPRPHVNDNRIIIPYFSLYSRDTYFPQDKPLLFELVELNEKYNPLEFFVNVIIGMVQDTWVYFVRERGLLPELHGQNTCLEINNQGVPTRIVHRDFQSLYSDRDTRQKKGLLQFKKHIAGDESNITKEQQYSLVFDHFICDYMMKRIVNIFVELYPQYNHDVVNKKIKDRFRNIPNNPLGVFPETIYQFSKKRMIGNEVTLENTKKKPIFR